MARTNYLIPSTLPAFYFEVSIRIKKIEAHWGVAVGLIREGLVLDEALGRNGIALGANGILFCSDGSLPFCEAFKEDCIIGVELNMRKNRLTFLHNGSMISNAIDVSPGRFYPAIWIEHSGITATLNLGHEPFVYDFESTLPKDFLEKSKSETAQTISSAELKRRTEALTLNSMCPDFPLELCIIALESCHDDLMVAANWLIERGWQELERLVEDTIRRSAQEAERALLAEQKEEKNDVQSNDDSIWSDLTSLFANFREAGADPNAVQMEDEIEADVPFGLDASEVRRDHSNSEPRTSVGNESSNLSEALIEPLQIENIRIGQILVISKNLRNIMGEKWIPRLSFFVGRPGRVKDILINSQEILLEVSDPARSAQFCVTVPIYGLHRLSSLSWIDPCKDMMDLSLNDMISAFIEKEDISSILKLRSALYHVASQQTDLNTKAFGGDKDFVDLLKLAGSQFVISQDSIASSSVMNSLEQIILNSIQKSTSILSLLVTECEKHFSKLAIAPPPFERRYSSHPYSPHLDLRECIHIPGAEKLMILFHPKCHLSTDAFTRLQFFRDPDYLDPVVTCRGNVFHPFVVPGNKVWFKFSSSGDCKYWGFEFYVKPVNLRLKDQDVKEGSNFHFACWLLEFLLEYLPKDLKSQHFGRLYQAISHFLLKSRSPDKQKVIESLTRLMLELPSLTLPAPIDFSDVNTLYAKLV